MKVVISVLLVLNAVFSSAAFLNRRLKRSAGEEFNSSLNSSNSTIFKSHFFAQKLDHFNPSDNRKWNQRYWIAKKYFEKGGPALLIANGAWSVEYPDEETDGDPVVESYAKEIKAVIFSLEHRYYGKSWPLKEDINYLNTRQSIADIANFIKGATEIFELPKDTKWIVIGCSYGGMLSTWARVKYPHLIHGAVVSSAPILLELDYYKYHQIIDASLNTYDQKCVEHITFFAEEIAHLINNTENIQNILLMLNMGVNNNSLCDDKVKNIAELATILYNDMVNILNIAVRGNDNETLIDIAGVCELTMNNNMTKLEIFIELRKRYRKFMEENSFDEIAGIDLWSYLECSEFGFFSSYYKNSTLSSLFALTQMIPIETELEKKCGRYYGPSFSVKELNEKVNQTNFLYGGLNINVGNMVFLHGSLDPWYEGGIHQKKDGASYETIFMNGTNHCDDLSSEADSPQLKNARIKVLNLIKDWLQK